ncbi:histidine phosphatase family protein [Rhodoligotrophos appendicifer]|uniref:histidine phosphatase family protein n=1 Tax=Rhodoligotrophos appendicifer TaxID=987056 RepID=UPI00118638BB|nr:histidine phosphatase family protein [Rhodoligotrophos appendicifer]
MFLLVRHAAHDDVGSVLTGRSPGVGLGEIGEAQALRLGSRLVGRKLDAVLASPQLRTRETAEIIATLAGAPEVVICEALDEIDFGTWSGRSFEDLKQDPAWEQWNAARSLTRTPAGESMLDVQSRMLRQMEQLRHDALSQTVVLVTHADVIKAALCFCLGMTLDAWPRLEISPASISTIIWDRWSVTVTGVNDVTH